MSKLLAKKPGDRYQHAEDLLVDLRLAKDTTITPPVARRHRPILISALCLTCLLAGVVTWRGRRDWQEPFLDARFTRLTDFAGDELDAVISRDGRMVAFLSDRDGTFDAWMGQASGSQFVNLTKGRFPELFHEQMPSIGFTPDGANIWLRISNYRTPDGRIYNDTWLLSTLGGEPKPFVKTLFPDWSPDGKRMASMEANPTQGEPIWVADASGNNPIKLFAHKGTGHCHYLKWSPDARHVYFTIGLPPSDISRVSRGGGEAERITFHDSRVVYPTLLDNRTLVYVAASEDGRGQWLYSMDLRDRKPRRFNSGIEQFLSVHASADGKRLVASVANPSSNLWSIPIADRLLVESDVKRFPHPTVRALNPRFGDGGALVYLSSRGGGDGIWKLSGESLVEIWKGSEGPVETSPSISADGQRICFVARKAGKNRLMIMTADGTDVRELSDKLDVRGTAAWSPDGKWITIASAEAGAARIYKIPSAGGMPVKLMDEPAYNPIWSADGKLILYEHAPSGTSRNIRAVTDVGQPYDLPRMTSRSGGDRIRMMRGRNIAVVLLGEFRRNDFWLLNLQSKELRRLTELRPGYTVKGFDITPDEKSIVFDRSRENSDIVLIELPER